MGDYFISTPFPFIKTVFGRERTIPRPDEDDAGFRLFNVICESERIEEADGIEACVQYLFGTLGEIVEEARTRRSYQSLKWAIQIVLARKRSQYEEDFESEDAIYEKIIRQSNIPSIAFEEVRILTKVRQIMLNIWKNRSKLSDEDYRKYLTEFDKELDVMRANNSNDVRKIPICNLVDYIHFFLDLFMVKPGFSDRLTNRISFYENDSYSIHSVIIFHACITFWHISLWGRRNSRITDAVYAALPHLYDERFPSAFDRFISQVERGLKPNVFDVPIACIYRECNILKYFSHHENEIRHLEINLQYKDVEFAQFLQEILMQVESRDHIRARFRRAMEERCHDFFFTFFQYFYRRTRNTVADNIARFSDPSSAVEATLRTKQMKETLKMIRDFVYILKKERIVTGGDVTALGYLENCLDLAVVTLGYLHEDVRNFVNYLLDEYELLDVWNIDREYLMTADEELDRLSRTDPSKLTLHTKGHEMAPSDCPACLSKKYRYITAHVRRERRIGLLRVMREFIDLR